MTNNTITEFTPPEPIKPEPTGLVAAVKAIVRYRRGDSRLYLAVIVSVVFATAFLMAAIWPRYKDPGTRLYSSRLGYPAVARELNHPFPVKTATVERRKLDSSCQGEGTMTCEPVLAPIVPVGRIIRVHVRVGDTVKKGQLLAEVDDRQGVIKVAEAKMAIQTALHEQERAIQGTPYNLDHERPSRDRIRVETTRTMTKIYQELLEIDHVLNDRNYVSKRDVLLDQLEAVRTEGLRRENEFLMQTADAGIKASLAIAANNVEQARLALKSQLIELDECKVYSPCDGVIERSFIHENEFNQDRGKPAFLIDDSVWFEARMEQAAIGQFAVGDRAAVYLQAFPEQPLQGRVDRIIPVVSYDLGGPKATRPVRPLGTGAPEWPSTFAARIKLDAAKLPAIPGMTGFARISPEKEVVAIPLEALHGRSGRTAIVYVANEDSYSPVKVVFGAASDGWVEVRSGLEPGMRVLSEGFQLLQPDDQVEVIQHDGNPVSPAKTLKYAKPEVNTTSPK